MNQPSNFCIGWDVGGWNCDKNPNSRDALVILNWEARVVGEPWRGNLRETIESADSAPDWLTSLFELCGTSGPRPGSRVTLAIDTPLGFSRAFTDLLTRGQVMPVAAKSSENEYLYRETERHLAEIGQTPLSPLKDMIGSQATKGMHALAKFAHERPSVGIWTGPGLTAFEAYPSVARNAPAVVAITSRLADMGQDDVRDALVCAAVACLYETVPSQLVGPPPGTPASEGWIWYPKRTEQVHLTE